MITIKKTFMLIFYKLYSRTSVGTLCVSILYIRHPHPTHIESNRALTL